MFGWDILIGMWNNM